ncbi:hypothetical protein M514_12639 [Trichuris suis]|uniref:Uncharacterized protein n=1 Tax=Trichuris suis TaxID=68888 RepID=A0A085MU55_9BILA|nr:hypothetical protein M513_12639 [Trichuris suis]KFD60751.1 hypothetical protein M514_12639 [Trichuris suis]
MSQVWVGKPEAFWPTAANVATPTATVEEIAEMMYVCTVELEYSLSEDRYENFATLLRATAWCLRFLSNAKRSLSERKFGPLQVELRQADKTWVYKAQRHEFQMEINCLRRKQKIPQTTRLNAVDPFLDQDDLLRVDGRMQMSTLSYETCCPLILSKRSKIVESLIRQCHQRNLHCDVEHTLSILRRKV